MLVAILLTTGCTTPPTPEQIANADYGEFPENHEDVVKRYYKNHLKDPDSALYQVISRPKKMMLGSRLETPRYGFLVCTTLNAKNSYGAYTGYQTDALLIRNGAVIVYAEKSDWWGRKIC